MIRSALLLVAVLGLPSVARAGEEPPPASASPEADTPEQQEKEAPPPEEAQEDKTLERYRTPIEVLSERMIGVASRAVRFDWRKKRLGFGLIGSQLLELNNFSSARFGGFVRKPVGSFMGELAITRVLTWGSDSTDKLALTPYRQTGRPSRIELDLNVGYPLAEGVATSRPGFFPATELVFSANAGVRYAYYPGALSGATFGEVARSLVAPRLSEDERENLEGKLPPGMQIDGGRYNLLAGLGLDVYFQTGGFFTPRAMVALPITGSDLGLWWELTFSAGWMF
ncbi:hypothetical protein [Hyalangium rubrum]|uniref:Outer membrane beta-barrel domain-containing protein n=1 Tax=Hyalangium rubrum TaxID=3103134 RepID=A0ABU5GZF4_9BACT|nr:hypothetical protein [Hyalangium sp. s54d21]MDY7226581.1 hypothetical protein [Hyalangium sp. s54d21]